MQDAVDERDLVAGAVRTRPVELHERGGGEVGPADVAAGSWVPVSHSSPSSAGRPSAPTTWVRVPPTAVPIAGCSRTPAGASAAVDTTVFSVGP